MNKRLEREVRPIHISIESLINKMNIQTSNKNDATENSFESSVERALISAINRISQFAQSNEKRKFDSGKREAGKPQKKYYSTIEPFAGHLKRKKKQTSRTRSSRQHLLQVRQHLLSLKFEHPSEYYSDYKEYQAAVAVVSRFLLRRSIELFQTPSDRTASPRK
jgi:hypothetical protein